MKPFNPKAFCPKCQSKDIGTLFCNRTGGECEAYNIGKPRGVPAHPTVYQPHFHWNCHRCKHEWFEAVKLTVGNVKTELLFIGGHLELLYRLQKRNESAPDTAKSRWDFALRDYKPEIGGYEERVKELHNVVEKKIEQVRKRIAVLKNKQDEAYLKELERLMELGR